MNEMQVVYMEVTKLKQYKNNAKVHPQEHIDQIKASILEFGFNDPCSR